MDTTIDPPLGLAEQNRSLTGTFAGYSTRLHHFIRRRVADPGDAEDILQEVFSELVEAQRLLHPIEQVGAWLFRVARNRITDVLRRRRTRGVELPLHEPAAAGNDPDAPSWEQVLASPDAGPHAQLTRRTLLRALDEALQALPAAQREVFVAHELEGRSFRDLSAESGVPVNTLLSRKHCAVQQLRRQLQSVYDDFETV